MSARCKRWRGRSASRWAPALIIAIESADVVVMASRWGAVADAVLIGRASYRKTFENIALAFEFNGVGIPVAMTGLMSPDWAMVASVSTVLANSFLGGSKRRAEGETAAASVGH